MIMQYVFVIERENCLIHKYIPAIITWKHLEALMNINNQDR